ncbi:MAG TPA: type 4a pilus biogenesis protein PilO [Terriglobales bacterium]|nr:type 4a pilus biogenesis protein PilO [Terriglobales bacterium]
MPVSSKLGVVAGAAILITAACYFLVFSDLITANKQTADKLKAVQADNQSLRPFEGKLTELDRQIENLKQQLEIQKRIVPDTKETDEFIHMVQGAANAAGIEVRRFTTKPTASKEFYTEAPYEMDIDGPYYSVLNFFDKLGKLERIINVSDLQMASVGDPGAAKTKKKYRYAPSETVVASFVATTFYTQDTQPAASAPAKNGPAVRTVAAN